MDENISLFLSHPENEKASFTAYYDTLNALVSAAGDGLRFFTGENLARPGGLR